MFTISLKNYVTDGGSIVLLDLEATHKDPTLFHITFTTCIDLIFEDGFCIKDANYNPHKNFKIIANTLFSEKEMLSLQKDAYLDSESENGETMIELKEQLKDFRSDIINKITIKTFITLED